MASYSFCFLRGSCLSSTFFAACPPIQKDQFTKTFLQGLGFHPPKQPPSQNTRKALESAIRKGLSVSGVCSSSVKVDVFVLFVLLVVDFFREETCSPFR